MNLVKYAWLKRIEEIVTLVSKSEPLAYFSFFQRSAPKGFSFTLTLSTYINKYFLSDG